MTKFGYNIPQPKHCNKCGTGLVMGRVKDISTFDKDSGKKHYQYRYKMWCGRKSRLMMLLPFSRHSVFLIREEPVGEDNIGGKPYRYVARLV